MNKLRHKKTHSALKLASLNNSILPNAALSLISKYVSSPFADEINKCKQEFLNKKTSVKPLSNKQVKDIMERIYKKSFKKIEKEAFNEGSLYNLHKKLRSGIVAGLDSASRWVKNMDDYGVKIYRKKDHKKMKMLAFLKAKWVLEEFGDLEYEITNIIKDMVRSAIRDDIDIRQHLTRNMNNIIQRRIINRAKEAGITRANIKSILEPYIKIAYVNRLNDGFFGAVNKLNGFCTDYMDRFFRVSIKRAEEGQGQRIHLTPKKEDMLDYCVKHGDKRLREYRKMRKDRLYTEVCKILRSRISFNKNTTYPSNPIYPVKNDMGVKETVGTTFNINIIESNDNQIENCSITTSFDNYAFVDYLRKYINRTQMRYTLGNYGVYRRENTIHMKFRRYFINASDYNSMSVNTYKYMFKRILLEEDVGIDKCLEYRTIGGKIVSQMKMNKKKGKKPKVVRRKRKKISKLSNTIVN